MPVATVVPMRSDIYATYAATATISSDRDAPVTAKVGGDIVELLVEEGETVVSGQALARLDGERLRLEMLAAKANLDRAERGLRTQSGTCYARGIVSAAQFDALKFDLESMRATFELTRTEFWLFHDTRDD